MNSRPESRAQSPAEFNSNFVHEWWNGRVDGGLITESFVEARLALALNNAPVAAGHPAISGCLVLTAGWKEVGACMP
jgi:hypothetical protein